VRRGKGSLTGREVRGSCALFISKGKEHAPGRGEKRGLTTSLRERRQNELRRKGMRHRGKGKPFDTVVPRDSVEAEKNRHPHRRKTDSGGSESLALHYACADKEMRLLCAKGKGGRNAEEPRLHKEQNHNPKIRLRRKGEVVERKQLYPNQIWSNQGRKARAGPEPIMTKKKKRQSSENEEERKVWDPAKKRKWAAGKTRQKGKPQRLLPSEKSDVLVFEGNETSLRGEKRRVASMGGKKEGTKRAQFKPTRKKKEISSLLRSSLSRRKAERE